MFSAISRCDAYRYYTVSVSLDMEFSVRGEEVLHPTGATISTAFAYGESTEFATVGPRILTGTAVSVHRARITHAHIRGRWLAFTPPMEKLLLVPTSRMATMPHIQPEDRKILEDFAQNHISKFVGTQCAHAGFDTTIRMDVVGAVFVASRAQALLAYFHASNTAFTSLPTTAQRQAFGTAVSHDDEEWKLDVPDVLRIVPSRVLVADPIDIATSYIEQTYHPLDFLIFAPCVTASTDARQTVPRASAPQPMGNSFAVSRTVEVTIETADQSVEQVDDHDFVLV